MKSTFARVVLWLFVMNLGIAFGAGVYEARVVIPPWAMLPPSTWTNTGILFWVYVTTVPLTLLTLVSLFLARREVGPIRTWWLRAVAIIIVERLMTFAYFIPTLTRVMGSEGMPQAAAAAILSQWLTLNNVRHLLTLAGWLCALRAFSLQGDGRTDRSGETGA